MISYYIILIVVGLLPRVLGNKPNKELSRIALANCDVFSGLKTSAHAKHRNG
jgi:hypothetical protein